MSYLNHNIIKINLINKILFHFKWSFLNVPLYNFTKFFVLFFFVNIFCSLGICYIFLSIIPGFDRFESQQLLEKHCFSLYFLMLNISSFWKLNWLLIVYITSHLLYSSFLKVFDYRWYGGINVILLDFWKISGGIDDFIHNQYLHRLLLPLA